jgi:hypothetical protein
MQSTGHTSTHALSFVPMQGSQMIYATQVSWTPRPGVEFWPGKYNPEVQVRRQLRPDSGLPG